MDSGLRARYPPSTADNKTHQAPAKKTQFNDDMPTTLTWQHLPEWAKDNEYIHTSYRPISHSYIICLKSCFYIHNETGNIYSHLLATFWMLALSLYFYYFAKAQYKDANMDDWIMFGSFFLGATICFALSSVYHTLSNHSHAVHDVYLRLDLLGISAVTAGCFLPGVWYTFPCATRNTKKLWISVCLCCSIATIRDLS